ncbi:hypothetical protein SAMN04488057_11353 [Cyclobacterium lianum]|uniref:Uncharacterized protein n=1 Tax=Cyclobacterium lianum TaxID=388280 RepID=A0A1M7Q2C2_9BACT|nr:hypothetical protein [Cyclobacterium lianum]SHN24343.1 hypothetical protein SAMN04488057_11353 [Cyclobacterium lianum]
MAKKLFPLDKNYILQQAQIAMEKEMMVLMLEELKDAFVRLFNPLKLQDDTYLQILKEDTFPQNHLSLIYQQLAGIYRFRYGSNQLEILFDGKTHFEKYQEDWALCLRKWLLSLGQQETYVKTMLRMTLLYDGPTRAVFAENRCKSVINDFFGLSIVKRKGDLLMKTGS